MSMIKMPRPGPGCVWEGKETELIHELVKKLDRLTNKYEIGIRLEYQPDPEKHARMGIGVRYDPNQRLATVLYDDVLTPDQVAHEIGHVRHHAGKYPRPVGHGRDASLVGTWVSSSILNADLAAREPEREIRLTRTEVECSLRCGRAEFSNAGHLAHTYAAVFGRYVSLFKELAKREEILQLIERKNPGALELAESIPLERKKYPVGAYKKTLNEAVRALGFEKDIHFRDDPCPRKPPAPF